MSRRSTWQFPTYLISRAARESMRVMLSGMGGDEVFAGYPRQMAMKLAGAFDPVPQLLRRPLMKTLAAVLARRHAGKTNGAAAEREEVCAQRRARFPGSLSGLRNVFHRQSQSSVSTPTIFAQRRAESTRMRRTGVTFRKRKTRRR